jgi:hypothetical protein
MGNRGQILMSRTSLRLAVMTALVLSSVSVMTLMSRSEDKASDAQRFYGLLAFNGREAEHYETVEEMAANSEVVVLGRLAWVADGRSYGDPEHDASVVQFASVGLEVHEVLAGQPRMPGQDLVVEFLIPSGKVGVIDLKETMPAEEAIFFLRNKGSEVARWGWAEDAVAVEAGFYRLVSTQGVVRNVDGRASHTSLDTDPVRLRQSVFDDVVATLRSG